MKVLIAVTHLLGSGHLARALTIARSFAAAGHDAVVASGGMGAPQLNATGVTLLQLPPLRSDGTNFTRLLTATGAEADAAYLGSRREALCTALAEVAPDILITELFPFGRRVLKDEFMSLLRTARAQSRPPVILASIRDILAPPSKPAKAAQTEALVAEWYDAVLVHSDPGTTPLEASWPVSEPLRAALRYTGFVAPAPSGPHPDELGKGEILVSAGGGPVGATLFDAALAAAARMPGHNWRLLVGGAGNAADIARMQSEAGANVAVDPARPDFRQMLYHAAASVSMCGYNTALDLLQAGTPSVLVPFEEGNEVEQILRARSLAALPGFELLRSAELDPASLCAAIDRTIASPRRDQAGLRFDGAARSVAIACQMAEARA